MGEISGSVREFDMHNCFHSRQFYTDITSFSRRKSSAMNKTAKTVSIGRTLQSCPCHACAFFTSKEEEYRVMLPFMAEGFEAGDKLVHIMDKNHRDERVGRLNQAGIDVA